ncbi:E3 ubiquitin/ISG15 ligase TRIM25-like [Haliotis rubra]|uniref:E3 ubiquitin/ISG15 ligase TRIM25-like n=1 Tax=Haliotis rubra TaxID=36100 RepID=UPI001EE58869|nr:E3 ubiquitin/ISG15 ligase TRIM25-like [Haliotis rubra]
MATAKKLTERHLSCSICTDVFKDPATLQCNHTFCKSCLLNYINTRPAAIQAKSLPCPSCRQLTKVTNPHRPVEEWVSQLKPSHVIQGLMDDFGPSAEPVEEHVCSVCTKQGKRTPATAGCSVCNVVFCDECFQSRMETGLCDHEVAQLSDHTETRVMCERHTDKQIELFCRDCKLEICTMCCSLNHRTCKDVEPIESVTHLVREQLTNKLEQLHTNMSVIDKILTRRKSEIEIIKSRSKLLSDQVVEAQETAVRAILRKEKQLLDYIDKATGEQLREFETDIESQEIQLQMYQQEYAITADALTSNSLKDMHAGLGSVGEVSAGNRPAAGRLVFTQDLDKLKKAVDVLQLGKVKVVHDVSDVESSPFLLHTIHCKEDGDRKKPDLFDVTVLSVDGINVTVVADYDNKRLKTYYTSNLKSCHNQLLLSNGPWQIAKYSESQVFVSVPDSKEIVTVNCTPSPVLRSIIRASKVYCALACLNSSQLVASIYEQPYSVDILDMSGRVLRSVTNKMIRNPDYIHVTSSSNLIVSERAVKSLLCVTSEGDTVFTYTPTGDRALTYPWGITTTCSGDVLLVDYDSKVIQLTESGQFVRDVLTRRDGVDNIRAVCVDNEGLMYVMSDSYVKVFEFRRHR